MKKSGQMIAHFALRALIKATNPKSFANSVFNHIEKPIRRPQWTILFDADMLLVAALHYHFIDAGKNLLIQMSSISNNFLFVAINLTIVFTDDPIFPRLQKKSRVQ